MTPDEIPPCCRECAYPDAPGVCVRRGLCTCHQLPLPLESEPHNGTHQ